jgi:hypothetical protein
VQLIRREVREFLGQSALEVLLSAAEHVVEGSAELARDAGSPGCRAGGRVYATVMVTIDLCACSAYFREPADDATAQRVAELMHASGAVAERIAVLARPELAELAGIPAEDLEVSLTHHVRAEGTRILIDGDALGRW